MKGPSIYPKLQELIDHIKQRDYRELGIVEPFDEYQTRWERRMNHALKWILVLFGAYILIHFIIYLCHTNSIGIM